MRKFTLTYLLVFVAVCLATWLIWVRLNYPLTGIDDSNIFFIYANNLSHGHGFVYNVGGERVEGFSSLLWTLFCAFVFSVSARPELTLLMINIIVVSLGITVALSYIQSAFGAQMGSRYERLLWPLLYLVLLLTSPNYMIWNTIALMENAIWSTLLILILIFVIKGNISSRRVIWVFTPLVVLLLLTRPEAFLWVTVFSAILLARKALTDGIIRALREMVPVLASIVVTVMVLTVFRLWYFGYPLPNTYYAKVSPSVSYNFFQGTIYFVKYFVSNPIVSLCIVAVILAGVHTILMLIQKQFTDDGLLFLPVPAIIGLLAPMITGGDHFSSFRFYQSVYPILLLCLLYFVKSILPHYIQLRINPLALRMPQLLFPASLALLFISSSVLYQAYDWIASDEIPRMSDEFEFAKTGREAGQFIREMFATLPELPSIGVVRAGGIKYTYPGEVVDLMGLNSLLMAHNGGNRLGEKNHAAFEKTTFYQLEPDLVSAEIVSNKDWQYRAIDLKKSWDNTVPLKGLYNEPAFLKLYVYAKVDRKEAEADKALVGWFQKEFLDELDASGYFVIERYEYTAN